jgi:hypothetical protein
MSRHISDLHAILTQLIAEQRRLLDLLVAQHSAMKKFDINAMADLMPRQEMTRLRITDLENKRLENKRRATMRQITVSLKLQQEPRLVRLAELFPNLAEPLLKARQELRDLAEQITQRTQGSGRLASAVLGHLNTVVRILAGAAQRAGLYTRQGIPRIGTRIGVMDAVG